MAGNQASVADIAKVRASLGLDAPLPVQLGRWVVQLVTGDLGTSIFSGLPVTQMMMQRVEPTASLGLATLVVTILVGVPLGVLAAWKSGSLLDRLVSAMSVVGFAVPAFILAYAMILVLSVRLRLFPAQGFVSITQGIGPFLSSICLPTITLSLVYIALVMRMTRAAMLDVAGRGSYPHRLRQGRRRRPRPVPPRAAQRRGAGGHRDRAGGWRCLIGGVVVTESVYNIPGMGRLVVDAVQKRDYPVIQGTMLVFAGIYVLVNFVVRPALRRGRPAHPHLTPRMRRKPLSFSIVFGGGIPLRGGGAGRARALHRRRRPAGDRPGRALPAARRRPSDGHRQSRARRVRPRRLRRQDQPRRRRAGRDLRGRGSARSSGCSRASSAASTRSSCASWTA